MSADTPGLCTFCPTPERPALVVVDLDGTVLDSADRIDPADRSALRAVAATARLAVATARPAPDAARWAREIHAQVCVSLGGAAVEAGDGIVWTAAGVGSDVLSHLHALARDLSADLHLHTLTGWHPSGRTPTVHAYGRRHGLTALWTPPIRPVLMAELVTPPGGLRDLKLTGPLGGSDAVATLNGDSQGDYLVVTGPTSDKRNAVGRVLGTMGVGWDRVLAMGDGLLDAPMLRAAATAVTFWEVHPQVMATATHAVSGGPGRGSIAAALDALFVRSPGPHPSIHCMHRKGAL